MQYRTHLAAARAAFGMAPSLDAGAGARRDAVGVGMVAPGQAPMVPRGPNGRYPNGGCAPYGYGAVGPYGGNCMPYGAGNCGPGTPGLYGWSGVWGGWGPNGWNGNWPGCSLPQPDLPRADSLSIADRSTWAKRYMAIEIPANSTADAPDGVLAGATLQFKVQSQVTVWITDFTVDTDEPSDFIITQLQISRVNLIGGSGGIPASRFRSNSRRPQINNEILNGGSYALLTIQNINPTAALSFYGSFEGLDLSKPIQQSL